VQALRRAGSSPVDGDAAVPQEGLWRAVRAGVLVGVTNPKTFVVFAAVLPPFVDRAAGAVPQQMLLLALVPVAIGMVTDSAWAVAAARARTWLASSPRRARTVARAGGLSMIALGASVAVTGRRL
jgi:threonine/homoserine/homoserine lactone efflux protein